jgi:hypothetical protein
MKTYQVTLEHPGLRDGTHYYSDAKVRAGSPERAKQIAAQRNGGHAIGVSEVRR